MSPASAPPTADLGSCRTEHGEAVRPWRLEYRTFGRLSPQRDNAVLVPTWYGGRSESMTWSTVPAWGRDLAVYESHAAGAAVSAGEPERHGRRPAPARDGAAAHSAPARVLGWSMGGMQAIAWALQYPDAVGQALSVAGPPRFNTFDMLWVRSKLTILDLAEQARLPHDTLAVRLALWHTVATTPAHENALPRDSMDAALAREAVSDWVAFHPEDNRLQLEALAGFDAFALLQRSGWARRPERPRILLLYVPEDHVTTPESFRAFARLSGAETIEFSSACGHLAPVCETAKLGTHVRNFLKRADRHRKIMEVPGRRQADSAAGRSAR